MTARDDIEAVAGGVLAGHEGCSFDLGTPRQYTEHGGWNCSCACGVLLCSHADECTCHRAHVAAVLAEALAPVVAEVRAEALREAADAWTQGAWSNVMLPKPTPPAVPVIAYSNRMGDWLRDRAEGVAEQGGGSDG